MWPSVLRPDRLAARLRRRGANLMGGELARAVAEKAGLHGPMPIREGCLPVDGERTRRAGRPRWALAREALQGRARRHGHRGRARRAGAAGRTPPSGATPPAGAARRRRHRPRRGRPVRRYELAPGYVHPHERWFAPPDRRRLERLSGTLLATLHEGLQGFEPPAASRAWLRGPRRPSSPPGRVVHQPAGRPRRAPARARRPLRPGRWPARR